MWWVVFFQAEDGIRDADVTGVQTCALPISRHDRAEPDDAGTQQARLKLDGVDHAAGAVGEVEREGTVPSDRRLAEVGADVLLYEGSERGLAHVVFPVDTGIDQHVDIAGRSSRMREAGSGGGIGQAARGWLAQSVAGQRAGGFNACAHSGPPGCQW